MGFQRLLNFPSFERYGAPTFVVTKRVKVEKESVDLKFQYLEFWAKNYAKVPVR